MQGRLSARQFGSFTGAQRILERITVVLVATLPLACAHLPPEAVAPVVCKTCRWWPSNAWLTIEKDREIIAKREVPGFPYHAFDVQFSEDHVAKVVRIEEPSFDSIYEEFRKLFAGHDMRLTRHGFKRAMWRGQLTCHLAATTWPEGDYVAPSGRRCANNLLFSVTPPVDSENLLDSLNIILDPDDKAAAAAVAEVNALGKRSLDSVTPPPGQIRSRVSPIGPSGVVDHATWSGNSAGIPPKLETPRTVPWDTVLSIVKTATRFDDVVRQEDQLSFGEETCIRNLPPDMVARDPDLADAIVRSFVQFSGTPEGRDFIVKYGTSDDPAALWRDPCLPAAYEKCLHDQNVYLLRNTELELLEAGCSSNAKE